MRGNSSSVIIMSCREIRLMSRTLGFNLLFSLMNEMEHDGNFRDQGVQPNIYFNTWTLKSIRKTGRLTLNIREFQSGGSIQSDIEDRPHCQMDDTFFSKFLFLFPVSI